MAFLRSIWDDISYTFNTSNMVRKLGLVNVLVFVLAQLVYLVCFVGWGPEGWVKFWDVLHLFCMPADWRNLLWHPWSPITSIFLHESFWHLFGNLIWLTTFGSVAGDLIGDRRVLPIYLLGGLAGGVVYFLSANLAPEYIGSYALGASAAVMALGGAAVMLNPDHRVGLLFLGEVKIKYILLVMVLLDLVAATRFQNAGGHAAHLGGLVMGFSFIYALRDGNDWSVPVNRILDRVSGWFSFSRPAVSSRNTKQKKMKVTYRNPEASANKNQRSDTQSHQERLDSILDKIKQQGFENLSQEEKDFLYEASKR